MPTEAAHDRSNNAAIVGNLSLYRTHSCIYIAGHQCMVGSAIIRALEVSSYANDSYPVEFLYTKNKSEVA